MAAEQAFRDAISIDENIPPAPRHRVDLLKHRRRSGDRRASANHIDGRCEVGVEHGGGALGRSELHVLGIRDADHIEAQNHVGVADVGAIRHVERLAAQQEMRNHRAALLRRPGLIEGCHVESLDPGRGGEQRVDRHDAGAADARHHDAVRITNGRDLARLGNFGRGQRSNLLAAKAGAGLDLHADEGRAIAQRARIILVARRLMNARFLAARGHHRREAHAIGLLHAIAAAFADLFVDHQAMDRLRVDPARAFAALFGGAFLVVDHRGDAGNFFELGERRFKLRPVADLRVRGEFGVIPPLRLLGENDGLANPLGFELPGQLRNGQRALRGLPAGHRDVAVVENLISNVEAGGDQRLHSQRAGMKECSVADILEHVMVFGERRHADPRRAFAAHVGEVGKAAVGIDQAHAHGVAADAAAGDLAREQQQRSIVRAAGTEIRWARGRGRDLARASRDVVDEMHASRDVFGGSACRKQAADHFRDLVGIEFARGRKQGRAAGVDLTDDRRPCGHRIQRVAQMQLEEAALFFDHQDGFKTLREFARERGVEREGHAELRDANAELAELIFANAQIAQGLREIVIRFSGAREAQPRPDRTGLRPHPDILRPVPVIQPIQARELDRRLQAPRVDFVLERERHRRHQPRVDGLLIIFGNANFRLIGIDHHGSTAVADIGDQFQPHPGARKSRKRDGIEAVIDDFLRISGIQKRNADIIETEVALMRDSRAFAAMIVAGEDQRAAVRSGSREIGMAKNVAGAIDAGSFAVPDADDAIDIRFADDRKNLAAHDRGRGEIFVDAGTKNDIVLLEQLARSRQLKIVAAERRAFVAGNERAGLQARAAIAAHLIHRQPHQRLDAGEIDASSLDCVFI